MTVRYKMVARYRVKYIWPRWSPYIPHCFYFFVVAGVLPPWLTAVELFHLRRFPKHIMVYKLISFLLRVISGRCRGAFKGLSLSVHTKSDL